MARKKSEARGALSRVVEGRLKEIEGCARRGESVKAYAARTGQSVHTLYEAMRQARRAGVLAPTGRSRRPSGGRRTPRPSQRRFVQAVVAKPAAEVASHGQLAWRLRLPGGAVLESTTPLDANSIERLVAALRAAP